MRHFQNAKTAFKEYNLETVISVNPLLISKKVETEGSQTDPDYFSCKQNLQNKLLTFQ